MDQVKIGAFIATLRKNSSLTQQQLGDKLGVTNKSVSRWENGNYLPDIEMLQLLSQEFHISIHELLAGQRLSDEEFRQSAEENLLAIAIQGAFSFDEKKKSWKRKWRKEHIWLFVLMGLFNLFFAVGCVVFKVPGFLGFLGVFALIEYGWQNNRMMIYVENHLYERSNRSASGQTS